MTLHALDRYDFASPARYGLGANVLPVAWCASKPGVPYTLPRGWEFPYDDVLNHRLERGVIVGPTHPVEGWLLGVIFDGFPRGLTPGAPVTMALEMYDEVGELYLEDLHFVVEPCPIRKTRSYAGLYGAAGERIDDRKEVAPTPGQERYRGAHRRVR